MLGALETQRCDIQGRLFENAAKKGLNSKAFIRVFMTGETAAALDRPYDRSQWMGEEYLLEEVLDTPAWQAAEEGPALDAEAMYWAGYLYRYWHYLTGETSAAIYAQVDADRILSAYAGFHVLDPAMAIADLKALESSLPTETLKH